MNVSKATTVSRLRKLADTLSEVDPKYFNINAWLKIDGSHYMTNWDEAQYGLNQHDIDLKKVVDKAKKNECGAAACALGWACSIPSFKKAGLVMRTDFGAVMKPSLVVGGRVTATDYDAGARFFGVNDATSEYLFDPSSYVTEPSAKQVARRIRTVADKIEQGFVIRDVNYSYGSYGRVRVNYVKRKG